MARPDIISLRGLAAGLIAAAFFIGPTVSARADQMTYYSPGDPMFDGFAARCDMPVVYRSTWHGSLAEHDDAGRPVIVLDLSLRLPARRFQRNFLLAHECAHHLLGHTSPDAVAMRRTHGAVVAAQEKAADCWAAQFLGQLGRDDEAKAMAEFFYRRGTGLPGGGYPSGADRSTLIQHCWSAAKKQRLASALSSFQPDSGTRLFD